MVSFGQVLLATSFFMPHGNCYLWKPELVGLHVVSDALIVLAYFSIPITLVYLVKQREDLPFNWVFLMFGAFIILCGMTHGMQIWTLWHPDYWVSGGIKAMTAGVSVLTAISLVPLMPKALAIPSPQQLREANEKLEAEVRDREQAEEELRASQSLLESVNEELENRVTQRTQLLNQVIAQLEHEVEERKQAQLTQQESEQRLRAILDNAPAAIYLKDTEGRFLLINRKCGQLFGLDPQAVEGKKGYDFLPAEVVNQHQENDHQVLTSRIPHESEETLPQADGLHTFLSVKFPLEDRTGEPYAVCGISTDITERKKAQAEQQKLVALIENSSDFIGIANLEGQPIYINQGGHQLVGLENSNYEQLHVLDFLPAESRQHFKTVVIPTAMQEGFWEGEYYFRHFATDQPIPVYCNIFTVKDQETQEPIAIATVSRDITERKAAENRLRKSEQQYREVAIREAILNRIARQIRGSLNLNEILETTVVEIQNLLKLDRCLFLQHCPTENPPRWEVAQEAKLSTLETEKGKQIPVSQVGKLAQFAFTEDVVCIDDVTRYDHPQVRSFFSRLGYQAILVLPVRTQSGEMGMISCISHQQPRHWEDNEVDLLRGVADQLAIAIDQAHLYKQSRTAATLAEAKAGELEETLKELQMTQSQLLHSEKMASIGQMVAGVAHEINNPVNFIHGNLIHTQEYIEDLLGLIELYQEVYPEPEVEIEDEIETIELDFVVEDLPKALNSMKVGTKRIREIIKSLRTFSRLDEAEMKEVNIHDGIESTLLILQNRLKAKGERSEIKIVKHYGDLPIIECYPGQLNQVFMNILSNAIDALEGVRNSSDGLPAQIEIITQVVDAEWLQIQISDNGSGISEEARNHIFDPFYTTKPVGKGTGLGLSISYQIIVDKHQGSLECMSQPGQGTSFVIQIPLQAKQVEADSSALPARRGQTQLR